MKTHQILGDSSGPDLDVVPQEEQNQRQRQHVGVPVPDGQSENLSDMKHSQAFGRLTTPASHLCGTGATCRATVTSPVWLR